jgi:hypothetical protein
MIRAIPHRQGTARPHKAGRVVTNAPFRLVDYRAITETPERNDYLME